MTPTRGVLSLLAALCLAPSLAGGWSTNDSQFLESIEKANLRFFQTQKHGPYDLLNDTAYYHSPDNYPANSSVAGIGFELTAICLGHYRGWISYSNAYEQVLKQLKFFNGMLSADPLVGERVNGWTWHMYWIADSGTNVAGRRYYMDDGLSLLDHSLLMGGVIFAGEYFKGTEAGDLAHKLYEETTWSWRPDGDYNFGYSENLLAVVECAEAPQYKKGTGARWMWESYIEPYPRTLQLYFWQYPHCWVDFRFRWDGLGRNHCDIARDSILYQRQRAIDLHNSDPVKYDMLGTNVWGWTAASSSEGYRQMAPWGLWLNDTWYDDEHASDSGSVTPIGLPPCMIYAGTETMAAMKEIFERFYINGWDPSVGERPAWSDVHGWINCINKGRPYKYYTDPGVSNQFSEINAGIDYGPNVLMLENYKIGSTWRWFMQNTNIAAGMYTIGFGAPQQTTHATFTGGTNEFGGGIGHWENDGTPVTAAYADADWTNAYVGGKVVRFVADNSNEGGWIDLNSADMRAKALLSFWIRCSSPSVNLDIGLKDDFNQENKVRLVDFTGGSAPTNWTSVKIPLERFCMTSVLTNDTWPGDLGLVSFAFVNAGGGTIDIDYLAFTPDTLAPSMPTNAFGVAQAGARTRVTWDPSTVERDVVGYHVWRRYDSTSGFVRVTSRLVPAYLGSYEDVSNSLADGREIRYAIQAFDNAEPQNSSLFSLEKKAVGGRLDVDWNNGRNPNTFGGTNDQFYGFATVHSFDFVYTNMLDGSMGWARRSTVNESSSGHTIDLANGDISGYSALSFDIRGMAGGEFMMVGLRDAAGHEYFYLPYPVSGRDLTTNWARVVVPLGEFESVSLTSVSNILLHHSNTSTGTVLIANIAFVSGQRGLLTDAFFTEAEDWARQYGSPTQDVKAGASGGQVLGQGWSIDGGDYADYEFFVPRSLATPTLRARYSCNAGNGRALEVRWNDAPQGSIVCTNTGGWGESSNHFSWAEMVLPSCATGFHKLTFYANGYDDPVNLDCWELVDSAGAARECEDYTSQVGSGGEDLKAGASGGEVLGQSWGVAGNSEAVYAGVDAGVHTGAWLHVWYACNVSSGRVVDAYIDGQRRARLYCAGTPGWGDSAADFDRAAARIGPISAGPHTIRFAVPGAGDGVNLDCFYIGGDAPDEVRADRDDDGLSDRQEEFSGTDWMTYDCDHDGIRDGDEVQFGRYGQVTDPLDEDCDDDGMNDLEEAISGTDPNNAAEFFQCLEIDGQPASGGQALGKIVRWRSATGRLYSICVSTTLLTSDFWPLTSGLPATPSVNTWTDTVSPDSPTLIYRIDAHR